MEAYMHTVKKRLAAALPDSFFSAPEDIRLSTAIVQVVSFRTAKTLIQKYEWLDNSMGTSELCFGLYFAGVLGGALSFGRVAGTAANAILDNVLDGEVMVLARGATEWWAPRNSASYLISAAARQLKAGVTIYRNWAHRVDVVRPLALVAYADERAGEYGYVYQASNWIYTGMTTPIKQLVDQQGHSRDIRLLSKYAKKNGVPLREQRNTFLRQGWRERPGYPKHRYVRLLDRSAFSRLKVSPQTYPKGEPETRLVLEVT